MDQHAGLTLGFAGVERPKQTADHYKLSSNDLRNMEEYFNMTSSYICFFFIYMLNSILHAFVLDKSMVLMKWGVFSANRCWVLVPPP